MGRGDLTDPDLPPAARERIRAYLAEVTSSLPVFLRNRRQPLLAEIAEGLADGFTAYRTAGLSPGRAAEAAIAEFGDPALLAHALVPELAAAHARRTTLALVRSGPVVGVLWVLAWAVARPVPAGWAVPWPPWARFVGPDGTVPDPRLFAPAVGMFLLTALVVLASTGRPGRWLPDRPELAPTATVVGAVICVACDLTVLLLLAGQVGSVARSAAWAPLAVAAVASLSRLVWAGRAARRLVILRAALHPAR